MTDVRDCVYDFIKRIDELEEENEQLKELLKEIRDSIVNSELKLSPRGFDLVCKTVMKIDEVLNE